MSKPLFQAHTLGLYLRPYDDILEKESEANQNRLLEVLAWLNQKISEEATDKKSSVTLDELQEFIELLEPEEKSGISSIFSAVLGASVIKGLTSVAKDFYYGMRDLLATRKVKTTLLTIGLIVLGAAIGIVLGTLVFPGIGSAAGGAAGATAAVMTAVGGTAGLSILGAFGGSWLGKKLSGKFFKKEKRFELSKRVTHKIKKQSKVSSEVAQMINGYLYNRAKTIHSPMAKRCYKNLRKVGILKAKAQGMEKIAHFFCQELSLLLQEKTQTGINDKLDDEIKGVVYILENLAEANFSQETLVKVLDVLRLEKQAAGLEPTLETNHLEPITENTPTLKSGMFEQRLTSDHQDLFEPRYVKEEVAADEIISSKVKDFEWMKKSYAQKKDSEVKEDNNAQRVPQTLVMMAKAYAQNTGQLAFKVMAQGDEKLAVQLYAAALQAGLEPQLAPEEYERTPEGEACKVRIVEKAHRLAAFASEVGYKNK